MSIEQSKNSSQDATADVDFGLLYNDHPEYIARRVDGSFEQERIAIEVAEFKAPNLTRLLPQGWTPQRVLEVGCGTGELIAAFPVTPDGRRVGVDISASNIASALVRFPSVEFHVGNFTDLVFQEFDCVILSDILEHVENDICMLADAACFGQYVLVNLPLEDNWFNCNRSYGVNDTSGHLRKYSLEQGLDIFRRAGLKVLDHHQIWIHETEVLRKTRQLRHRHFGTEYRGGFAIRILKQAVNHFCHAVPPVGRRMFSSNLFAIAQKASTV